MQSEEYLYEQTIQFFLDLLRDQRPIRFWDIQEVGVLRKDIRCTLVLIRPGLLSQNSVPLILGPGVKRRILHVFDQKNADLETLTAITGIALALTQFS